jgi:hypothetical protein
VNLEQKTKLEAIAHAILNALSLVAPAAGAAGAVIEDLILADKLFELGAEYSDLMAEIRAETQTTAAAIGDEVSQRYVANRDRMLASFAAHSQDEAAPDA